MLSPSHYTANLAAFLTRKSVGIYLDSVETAVSKKVTICALGVLEHDLKGRWPKAKFHFSTASSDMIEAYRNGECQALAYGKFGGTNELDFMQAMCEFEMVYVPTAILHEDVWAFPVASHLAAGISHYIGLADEGGVSYRLFQEDERPIAPCQHLSLDSVLESKELEALTPLNMMFPFVVMAGCIVASIISRLVTGKRAKTLRKKTKKKVFKSVRRLVAIRTISMAADHDGSIDDDLDDFFDGDENDVFMVLEEEAGSSRNTSVLVKDDSYHSHPSKLSSIQEERLRNAVVNC